GRELRTMIPRAPVYPTLGVVAALHWSPDGRRLASAIADGLVRIWDPETGRETARIAHDARSVAWRPDGTRIALGGGSGLEVRPGAARAGRPYGPVLGQPGLVRALAWSPDGGRLAIVSFDQDQGALPEGLSVWDTSSGERLFRVGQPAELRSVAFSP